MDGKISSDEYMVDWCSLTQDECQGSSCIHCSEAKEHAGKLKIENERDKIREFTTFERKSKIGGIPVLTNHTNVIAKLKIKDLKQLRESGVLPKTKMMYDTADLEQYETQFDNLRKYNNFPLPDVMYVEKDRPAVFIWEEFGVFCIAPRIESEDGTAVA